MFSKGTKRKFSDGGEEVAEEEGAVGSGEEVSSVSYSLQRQSLLDMSLIKLQLCHMLVEPNLCRSVLIANTVRQIQEEMTNDGSWQTAAMMEAFAAAGSSGDGGSGPPERLVATEVLCRPGREMAGTNRVVDTEHKVYSVIDYEGCREEEVVTVEEEQEEEDDDVEVEENEHEQLAEEDGGEEEEDSICSEAASNVCLSGTMGHCWERGVLRRERELGSRLGGPEEDVAVEEEDEEDDSQLDGCRGGETKAMRQVFGTFEIKNGHTGPESALEELFSDVDASYYDLDTMLTGIQTAPKIGPYDLLDSLSQSHSPSSIGSASNCRADLNELDHIMEIIVGS